MPETEPYVVAYNYKTLNQENIGNTNPNDPFVDLGAPLGGLILQPRKSTFTPTTLGNTKKIYVGTLSDVQTLALWVANNNWQYEADELPGGVNYQITITLPYDEITNVDNLVYERVQWEIIEKEVQKDLFDAGIFLVNSTGYLDTTNRYTVPVVVKAAILEALKYGAFGSLKFSNINGKDITPNQQAALNACYPAATQFLNLLRGKVTSVRSSTIIVRRTAVYSTLDTKAYDNDPYYTVLLPALIAAERNINPVISKQDLIRIYQPDLITQNQLLNSYLSQKSLAGSPWNDTIELNAYGGYLVHIPTRTFITPTKVKIEQQFDFDEWLDCLYPRFSPISDFPTAAPVASPYPPGYTGFPQT